MSSRTNADKPCDVVCPVEEEGKTTHDVVNVDNEEDGKHALPAVTLLAICAALAPDYKSINALRKTCANFASGVNVFMSLDDNLPPIEAIAIRIQKGAMAVVALISKNHVGLHPLTYSSDGELKMQRLALPRKGTNYVAMVESTVDKVKCSEMAQVLRGRVKRVILSMDNRDESMECASQLMEGLKIAILLFPTRGDCTTRSTVECIRRAHPEAWIRMDDDPIPGTNGRGKWINRSPFDDVIRVVAKGEVKKLLRRRGEEEDAEETWYEA